MFSFIYSKVITNATRNEKSRSITGISNRNPQVDKCKKGRGVDRMLVEKRKKG